MHNMGASSAGEAGYVLIVEDDYFIAQELREAFYQSGARIAGPTGDLGVATKIADTQHLRLAVLDLNLAGEMVFPLAERLRARSVPIVFATGYDRGVIPDAFSSVPIIPKPFNAPELARSLLRTTRSEVVPQPFSNRLMRMMSDDFLIDAMPHLSRLRLAAGDPVQESGRTLRHFWFIESGVCSFSPVRGQGVTCAQVGSEGFVGAPALIGATIADMDCRMTFAGSAIRAPAPLMLELLKRYPESRDLLVRYGHTLHLQAASTAYSASCLSVHERVARYILMAADRVGSLVPATHELIADALDVRRAGVTEAVQALETDGAIERRRGIISVRDRALLRALAGAGYGVAESAYDSLVADHVC